jgi:PAS domain S-box-containing protein
MKISIRITFGFLAIIIFGIIQMVVTYKLQSDIIENTRQIKDVEAPLEVLALETKNYNNETTKIIYSALLYLQKGDYEAIKEAEAYYNQLQSEINSRIEKKQAFLFLGQSQRPQAVKDRTIVYLKNITGANIKVAAIEIQFWDAINRKDFNTADSLVTGGNYAKDKVEISQNIQNWIAVEHEMTLIIRNNILRNSQQVLYSDFIIAIALIIITLLVLLLMRSFIKEQYKLYELIFESSADAIMILKPPTWNFTSGNAAAFKMFNVKDKKQFTSFTPGDLSPEKQPEGQLSSVKAKEMIDQAMKEGSAFFEWTHKKYEGKDFYATVLLSRIKTKREIYLQATVRDITEDRKKDDLLAFKNIILSTQQEISLDGILVVDENGKILSHNKNFVNMWGIPLDVIKSKSDERALQSVMDKLADPEEFINKVKHLYKARKEKSKDDIFLKDGRVFDRYSAPMFGVEGKYYGRVWYFRDITKRKKAEKA